MPASPELTRALRRIIAERQADRLPSQYRIGSITKTFTAVAVMQLRDERLLDLDDRLDDHLPGAPAGSPTMRRLLASSLGLPARRSATCG